MIDRYQPLFFTLALDAQPFLPLIYSELRKLKFAWDWWCMEGVAAPQNCSKWVKQLAPRLSTDGTTGYLKALSEFDKRVHYRPRELWPGGKVQMCNYPLKQLHEPKLLWQMDTDEIWTAEQITVMRNLFIRHKAKNTARFRCHYFVGPDIVITSREGFGNNSAYEWYRVWKIEPGMRFISHEPPKMGGMTEIPFTQKETEKEGLVFDHFAWSVPSQVAMKADYYGSPNNEKGALYNNLPEQWQRLQRNEKWPVTELKQFMPFVGDGITAERITL